MDDGFAFTKREALESLLDQGDVLIQLDPRRQGVRVPEYLAEQPLLVLRIGLDMPVPIPDLRVHAAGVEGTLSFNREPHHVSVPWDAIFGMVSEAGRGLLWTADVPAELFDGVIRSDAEGRRPQDGNALAGRPRFVALDGGRSATGGEGEEPGVEAPASSRPHLRLVE